ncbi:MAG: OBG GTPase family GTP-binding protein [Candidatus Hodarchaeales archaeon]|jgi:small GTP-binding protein
MSEKIEERIAEIEAEMAKMQYNKATQGHFATCKARIAQLRSELVERAVSSKRKGSGFAIKKHGDATVILLGFPSVGKSTLLTAITNKDSKIAAYEFTTLEAIPGMMEYDGKYKGARIQIIDLPGVIRGGATGRGRGREIFSAVRNADLILIMLDATHPEHLKTVINELYNANVRLNQSPPRIRIRKNPRGGLNITGFRAKATKEEIKNVLRTYRVLNADVFLNEKNISLEQVIDFVAGNRKYITSLVLVNKIDLLSSSEQLEDLKRVIGSDFVPISAEKERGLEELKEIIVEKIGLIRIYLRSPGKKADLEEPMIVKRGVTVMDICLKIHRHFREFFRFANIWGPSAKFPGQKVGLNHELKDSDIVKIVLEK